MIGMFEKGVVNWNWVFCLYSLLLGWDNPIRRRTVTRVCCQSKCNILCSQQESANIQEQNGTVTKNYVHTVGCDYFIKKKKKIVLEVFFFFLHLHELLLRINWIYDTCINKFCCKTIWQINPNVIQVHTNVQVFLFNLMLYIKILSLKM